MYIVRYTKDELKATQDEWDLAVKTRQENGHDGYLGRELLLADALSDAIEQIAQLEAERDTLKAALSVAMNENQRLTKLIEEG